MAATKHTSSVNEKCLPPPSWVPSTGFLHSTRARISPQNHLQTSRVPRHCSGVQLKCCSEILLPMFWFHGATFVLKAVHLELRRWSLDGGGELRVLTFVVVLLHSEV